MGKVMAMPIAAGHPSPEYPRLINEQELFAIDRGYTGNGVGWPASDVLFEPLVPSPFLQDSLFHIRAMVFVISSGPA